MELKFLNEECELEDITKTKQNKNGGFGNASKFTAETILGVYNDTKKLKVKAGFSYPISRNFVISLLNPNYTDKLKKDNKDIKSLKDFPKLCDSLIIPLKKLAEEEGYTNKIAIFSTRDNATPKERVLVNWNIATKK